MAMECERKVILKINNLWYNTKKATRDLRYHGVEQTKIARRSYG